MSRGIRTSYRSRSAGEAASPTMDALWEACSQRFLPPAYRLGRESASGTVWVSLDGHGFTLGIRPNQVERLGLDAVLLDTDTRLLAFKSNAELGS